jgi:hypothetical protein
MFVEDWKNRFFYEGIKFGDIHVGDEHPRSGRILVQAAMYPFHYYMGKFLVVEFEKEKEEIRWDPDVYNSQPTPRERGTGWYGHYVNRIKPAEIIKVYPVVGVLKKELWSPRKGVRRVMEECLHVYTVTGKKVW